MEERWLLYPAAGDIDADDGLTKRELAELLAAELGMRLVPLEAECDAL